MKKTDHDLLHVRAPIALDKSRPLSDPRASAPSRDRRVLLYALFAVGVSPDSWGIEIDQIKVDKGNALIRKTMMKLGFTHEPMMMVTAPIEHVVRAWLYLWGAVARAR